VLGATAIKGLNAIVAEDVAAAARVAEQAAAVAPKPVPESQRTMRAAEGGIMAASDFGKAIGGVTG
jgi:hypothetical protein